MRPVGAPQHAIGRGGDERPRRTGTTSSYGGVPPAVSRSAPDTFTQQRSSSISSSSWRNGAWSTPAEASTLAMWSMTYAHGMSSSSDAYSGEVLGVEVQHDVPAERHDPMDDPPELAELGRATEVGDEVEPCATHAGVVQLGDVGVGERLVDHRHARVATLPAMQGVDHRRVVGAVAAGLHEHGPRQPEPLLQAFEVVDAGVGRRVRPVGGVRELVARTEDVAMRVARAGRRREPGRGVRVRMRWCDRRFHQYSRGRRRRPSACAPCG